MTDSVKDLLNQLLQAIECERQEEQTRHTDEIKQLSGQQREQKGRALIGLNKQKIGRALGGDFLYKFRKNGSRYLPETQFSVGDQVIISQYDPLDAENPKGTVYEVSSRFITVATASALAMSNSRPIRLDLFVNDITFQRMNTALTSAKTPQYSQLHALLSGFYHVNSNPKVQRNSALNNVQNRAVNYALTNNGYYSVQGPPGTGKTHTAAHLIHEIVTSGQRLLICADSNAAVDNLIRKLAELGENPLRIGNPIRVNADLKAYTLDYKVLQHVLYKDYQAIEQQAEQLKIEQGELERPTPKYTRGLRTEQLLDIYQSDGVLRGVNKQIIKRFKPWLKTQINLDALYDQLRELKAEIQSHLLASHQIIASTNSTAGSDLLAFEHFDWVILDEAAQASIPSSLIPILKADRFVLFGDHFQLPPVVISTQAIELGLGNSLMSYLAKHYPYQLTRLTVQYRMHQQINDLVSHLFYDGQLAPDASVKNRRLSGDDKVISYLLVKGDERRLRDSKSYYNIAEIDAVEKQINALLARKIAPEQIAVITPYKAQATKIAKRLENTIEVDTVDAFQGREKDIVIISFVRSNDEDNIGFLKDFRRLNVSISRAKKRLILIGDFDTLRQDALYDNLFELLSLIDSES